MNAGKILVALKGEHPMQEMLPIVQTIAKPGMKVTFLVPYPVDRWGTWLRDHWITTESARKAASAGRKIISRYSWEEQKRLAERRISVAREALEKVGVEVGLALDGRFRSTLCRCVLNEEFQFILMSAGTGETMLGLLRLATVLLRRIKRPSFSSFLLCRGGAVSDEHRYAPLLMPAQNPLTCARVDDSQPSGEA